MAQVKLTDYFPQTKKAKRDPLSVKPRKGGSRGDTIAATGSLAEECGPSRRKVLEEQPTIPQARLSSSPLAPVKTPVLQEAFKSVPANREEVCTTPTQEANKRVSAFDYLVTPTKDEKTPTEFDLGSAVFGPGSDRGTGQQTSTAKKRSRSDSIDEAEPRPLAVSALQGPQRVPSARRCLVLQPRKAGDGLHQDTTAGETAPLPPDTPEATDASPHEVTALRKEVSKFPRLQDLSKGSQQVDKAPGKEGLLALKSRLQRIQKLSQTAHLPAPSELSTDAKSRLKRVRELGLKVQENKEREKTDEPEEKSSEDERVKTPAYQRFHNLAQDVPPGLTLPFRYKVLAGMFRSMDTVVSMLFNRSETITFAKVKKGVQDMMRKQFDQRNVGQIKTVYPSAYKFRQEKGIPTWSGSVKKSDYQLTIDPVFEGEEEYEGQTQLKASHMLLRRRIFHRNLTNIVKQYHKAFLASLNPPMYVPDDKLTRWHPRFNVDEVPDVVAAELPQPPDFGKLTTAQEVLDKARSMMTPKMEKALANMALKSAETAMAATTERKEQTIQSPRPSPGPSNALKGISQSLLERIRSKEAQKLQAVMTRNPAQTERLHMMTRLPEITRILRNVFVAEKKPALNISMACNRVIDSYRSSMPLGDMEKHLRLLADIVPDWLTIHIIRKDVYLKLNKDVELSMVVEKIAKKIKEEEKA
ncbi:DNA replication factor Cdt1 [Hypanus sabinus]|uniref:DNA replication factor Cdt1 n=1 Tax=Hypanus sabinus TaxID=79690 RepID=UPI0028C47420|nr:DNA replication factor Cdt1 [Hypanus sabinus]